MSGNLRLYGATSGYSQISAPDVAGDQIFVVPSLGGEVIVSGNNQSLDLGTGDLTVDNITANSLTLPTGAPVVGYQQGTWIPNLDFNYSVSDSLIWWRIGNVVTLQGQVGNFSNREDTRTVKVMGLPYPSDASVANTNIGVCQTKNTAIPATGAWMFASGDPQGFAFYESGDGNSVNWASIKFNQTTASTTISWTVSYLTDDTTWTPINGATVS